METKVGGIILGRLGKAGAAFNLSAYVVFGGVKLNSFGVSARGLPELVTGVCRIFGVFPFSGVFVLVGMIGGRSL